jgi:hypothetical protein
MRTLIKGATIVNADATTPAGTAQEVSGGTSFSDAPALEPGTYTDTIMTGETLTYRVRLEYGQHAEFDARFPTLPSGDVDRIRTSLMMRFSSFAPTRRAIAENTFRNVESNVQFATRPFVSKLICTGLASSGNFISSAKSLISKPGGTVLALVLLRKVVRRGK